MKADIGIRENHAPKGQHRALRAALGSCLPHPPTLKAVPVPDVGVAMRVLITGAGRGIGAALSKALLAHGHCVVATYRDYRRIDPWFGEAVDQSDYLKCLPNAQDADAVREQISKLDQAAVATKR